MANPSPVYIITYDGDQLPGYAQSLTSPINLKSSDDSVFGRDGIIATHVGASSKRLSLTMLLMSTLGTGVSGLDNLDNVMGQYRTAAAILTRNPGMKQLIIHDSDRYFLARVDDVSMPLAAGKERNMRYDVSFTAQPWAYAVTAATSSFSGNGAANISIGDSRETYPIFVIPATVTAFTATDENGKVLTFARGANTGIITIDCGALTAINASGVNAITAVTNLAFGLSYKGDDGVYGITISGYAGSGTVNVSMRARYEI